MMSKSKSTSIDSWKFPFGVIAFLLLIYTPSSVASTFTWTSDNGDTYHIHQIHGGLIICSKYRCNYIRYYDFMTHYKGLFRSAPVCQGPHHALNVLKLPRVERHTENERSRSKRDTECDCGRSDGDQCYETIQCTYSPTNESYQTVPIGVCGIQCTYSPTNESYQTVPIGVCGDTLNCEGTCVQMQTVHSLLVFDPSGWAWPWWKWFTFKQFYFPSHCTCHT